MVRLSFVTALLGIALPAAAASAEDWSRDCEAARCTVAARLTAPDTERLFATISVVFGADGADPLLQIATPLGVAARPGARLVLDDATAFDAALDVCFPDGCLLTRALSPDEARALAEARALSIRYFAFGADAPLSADVSVAGLAAALDEFRAE